MFQENKPLVSVVTPSFNQANYINDTIQSVLSQDYPNIEHIIVDGGSTDGTLDILRKYPHLKWVSERDRGQSDAINKGFRRASGSIIGWLNSDDLYEPGAISRSVKHFIAHPDTALIYTDFNYIDSKGALTSKERVGSFDRSRQLNEINLIPQPTVFFRSAIFEEGFLDEQYHYAMDYDFWLRISERHKIERIDGVNASFRLQPESKTTTQLIKFYPEVFRISRRHGGKLFSRQNFRMVRESAQMGLLAAKQQIKQLIRSHANTTR